MNQLFVEILKSSFDLFVAGSSTCAGAAARARRGRRRAGRFIAGDSGLTEGFRRGGRVRGGIRQQLGGKLPFIVEIDCERSIRILLVSLRSQREHEDSIVLSRKRNCGNGGCWRVQAFPVVVKIEREKRSPTQLGNAVNVDEPLYFIWISGFRFVMRPR